MQVSARHAVLCIATGSRAGKRNGIAFAAAGGRRRRGAHSSSGDSSGGDRPSPPPAAGGSGSGSGSREPATAAAAASVSLGLNLLSDRRLLADKLTATAKNIVWVDPERPTEATREEIAALQARLGYRFKNLYLLRLALIHSSAAPTTQNSIMAWIGDAALYLIVAEEVSAALGYVPIGKLR
jgi:hypothetical protein